MKPGENLDALVAEKVLNLKRVMMPITDDTFAFVWEPGAIFILPKYSTDIAATWEVVEKMRANEFTGSVDFMPCYYRVLFHRIGIDPAFSTHQEMVAVGAEADTAPHAICLAALKAAGVEI